MKTAEDETAARAVNLGAARVTRDRARAHSGEGGFEQHGGASARDAPKADWPAAEYHDEGWSRARAHGSCGYNSGGGGAGECAVAMALRGIRTVRGRDKQSEVKSLCLAN